MATHKHGRKKVYLDNIHVSQKRLHAEVREVGTAAPVICGSLWFCSQWLAAGLENDNLVVCDRTGKPI